MDERPFAYSYIRLSTEPQTRGHGRQRQLEESAAYAKEHGLQLIDEGEPLEDVLSAFKGAHLKEGAFGRFLGRAKKGLIPKGSYLLVESLDRISRQEIQKSFRVFLDILDAGINVVTLQDKRIYRADKMTAEDFLLLVSYFSRGHNESFTKSDRLLKSWANKRANIHEKKLTALCPAWLKLSADGKDYEVIKERARIIHRIFEDSAKGIGTHTLQKRLNNPQTGTSPIGRSKSNRWHRSYIIKILNNRAVLGEFQPHRIVNGKREPVGKLSTNYFPRIIEDDLFDRARQSKRNRKISGRGPKGPYVTNLFSGVVSCWYCRSRMVIVHKGKPPKGGIHLMCAAAHGGKDCIATRWPYNHFELSFLNFIEQLNLPHVLGEADPEKRALMEKLFALEARRAAIKDDINIAWTARRQRDSLFLGEKIFSLEQELESVDIQLRPAKDAIENHEAVRRAIGEGSAQTKRLVARLRDQTRKRDDLYEDRSQVADRIKTIVEEIEIATEGGEPAVKEAITYINPDREHLERRGMFSDKRFFLVTFKDAGHSTRVVIPPDDPDNVDQYGVMDTGDPDSVT
jgi:DNA invertase Pin-like site-specific DNA recombinase